MLLSSNLSPVSRRPALIVVKSQVSSCLQQPAEQPGVAGEDGGVDRSAPVITAATGQKAQIRTLANRLFANTDRVYQGQRNPGRISTSREKTEACDRTDWDRLRNEEEARPQRRSPAETRRTETSGPGDSHSQRLHL